MKTIQQKREDLKNQRVKVCFMAKKHCLDIEKSMQFIKLDDLADIEVSLIWSDLKIWGIENGIIMTNERNSKLDWWI